MSVEVNSSLITAHELKGPLCLIRQLALLLNDASDPVLQERLQAQLLEVSERALRQVEDLTKVARLEDGLFTTEPVSVRGVCDQVLRELHPLFQLEQRKITLSYRNKARLAVANRDLLYSIIYNFCINALHYSDVCSRSNLSVSDHAGKVRIGVRDYGPALPFRIWQELQNGQLRTPTAIAQRPGSSGLGLYIAARFAESMQAKIGAIRHRDGASFYVELLPSQQMSLL